MADLDELMTDEAPSVIRGLDTDTTWEDARNVLRAELRPGYRALRESHDALEKALRELVECEELEMQMYGSFPGGDPRCFTPDEEVNTPEELSAWKAACEAWDRGEGQDTGPQCQTMGDGSVVTGTGFGMGVTRWQHPAVEVARAALAKAEALHA